MSDHEKHIDDYTGVETTGHDWDGIKELNNPLPRWWLWTFYLTILFSIGYTIAYPAWPLLNTNTKGLLGWSSRGDVAASIAQAKEAQGANIEKLLATDVSEIASDAELNQFAVAGGSAAFKVNCVQCHGSGAAGSPGYPNLNDDDWIWGGTPEDIYITLQHGIRYAQDDDTRVSDMPAYGADEILSREEISDVAHYVGKIASLEFDAAAADRGAVVFEENCAACHGDDGKGIREVGAPNLTDVIWLYGGRDGVMSHEEMVAQISKPQQGVMPGWGARLGEVTIKQLTAYVHSLGGGE